jgi:hypothetical protein
MDSKTWVFSHTADGEYPVTFCGSEEEMDKAATSLMERYRERGYKPPLTVWTGYSWMKKKGPYCQFDEHGKHILGATA